MQAPNYGSYGYGYTNPNAAAAASGSSTNLGSFTEAAAAYAQYNLAAAAAAAGGGGAYHTAGYNPSNGMGQYATTAPSYQHSSMQSANSVPIGEGGHYSGYEQAVYAAANSYVQAKGRGGGGGGGGGGRFYPKKRPGLGSQQNVQVFMCDVCKVSCAGQISYKAHLDGKAHKKKEALVGSEGGTDSLTNSGNAYKCEACNISCTSKDTFQSHLKGAKHVRALAVMGKMNLPIPASMAVPAAAQPERAPPAPGVRTVVGITGTKFVAGTTLSSTLMVPSEEEEKGTEGPIDPETKPVGQEFIEEMRDSLGRLITISCKLCGCRFTDVNGKDMHLKGRRHRLQYKTKVDPSLEVEMPPNKIQRHQRQTHHHNRFNSPSAYVPPPPMRTPFLPSSMPDSHQTADDGAVIAKDGQIQLGAQAQAEVEQLVLTAEKTLRTISDVLASEGGAGGDGGQVERSLKGVMRVGLLPKNLLLRTDDTVELAVLCSAAPTEKLLLKVVELFPLHCEKTAAVGDRLEVVAVMGESCFIVRIGCTPLACRITLTSAVLRNSAEGGGEKPVDALPVEPCLRVLAELRHCKWYQVKAEPIEAMAITLRILRDIANRVFTWSPLSTWAMELLVERTLASAQMRIGPGAAVRRVFEVIASGFLINKGAQLLDPCEKEQVDVLRKLGPQEREDITSSAQHALRLINFQQIDKILALDRSALAEEGAGERKRPSESPIATAEGEAPPEAKKGRESEAAAM